MIVGELKPLQEIIDYLRPFKKVFIVGCSGCVSVCLSGGLKNAEALARELDHPKHFGLERPLLHPSTFLRQCEKDMVKNYLEIPEGVDAVLSIACGAGVQTLAELLPIPVIPGLDTSFLGSFEDVGTWAEKCRGCGRCILAYTAGICPIARCAKKLLNGPCGGTRKGKCEISEDVECAWYLIVERLKALGRLDDYMNLMDLKDWSKDRSGGPRVLKQAIPKI